MKKPTAGGEAGGSGMSGASTEVAEPTGKVPSAGKVKNAENVKIIRGAKNARSVLTGKNVKVTRGVQPSQAAGVSGTGKATQGAEIGGLSEAAKTGEPTDSAGSSFRGRWLFTSAAIAVALALLLSLTDYGKLPAGSGTNGNAWLFPGGRIPLVYAVDAVAVWLVFRSLLTFTRFVRRFGKRKLDEHPRAGQLVGDYGFRTVLSAYFAFSVNLIFAGFKFMVCAGTGSLWFGILGGYYAMLGISRYLTADSRRSVGVDGQGPQFFRSAAFSLRDLWGCRLHGHQGGIGGGQRFAFSPVVRSGVVCHARDRVRRRARVALRAPDLLSSDIRRRQRREAFLQSSDGVPCHRTGSPFRAVYGSAGKARDPEGSA